MNIETKEEHDVETKGFDRVQSGNEQTRKQMNSNGKELQP